MPGHVCELVQISNSGLSVTRKCFWPWPWAFHILGAVSIVATCNWFTVCRAPGKPAHQVGPLHILGHLRCTCAGEDQRPGQRSPLRAEAGGMGMLMRSRLLILVTRPL